MIPSDDPRARQETDGRIRDLEVRVMELEMDRVVPGVMVCDVCKFQLNTVVFDVVQGCTGAPIAPSTDPCPNGCGPLRSLTWREDVKRADESMMRAWEALEESVKLQSHYANLLNMHDGGERLTFDSPAAWMNRLDALKAGTTR